MTTPLLAGHAADAPILHVRDGGQRRAIEASRFVAAVLALAARLPRRHYAMQRCETTLAFLVSSGAAWCAGQTVIMPPTRLDADRDVLVARYPDAYELTDDDVPASILDGVALSWPPPPIDDDLVAAVLFTSGSTREPRAVTKTWGSLCRGARVLADALGIAPRSCTLAGTVNPQHMFGLEATAMAVLHTGCALDVSRPRYAADLGALARTHALAGSPPLLLATTPLHLQHFHASLAGTAAIARVVVSTMPMPRELATVVERDWRARVDEIYGSTECGVIASRRPAHDDRFVVAPGLALSISPEGSAVVSGGQLDAPVQLDDKLAWADEARRCFDLLGRTGDMVKVAGKRTTLTALGDHLRAIDGVVDGVFFPSAVQPGRLCALAVAPTLSEGELRRRLAERIDAAFMPRPLILTGAMPRDDRGKLALTALHRMVATAEAPAEGEGDARCERIARELVVAADHPALPGHFPGSPVVPGALLLAQLEGVLRERGLRIVACRRVKFVAPVPPEVRVALDVAIGDLDAVTFTMKLPTGLAASGTLRCARA